MVACPKCGTQNRDTAKFCHTCGARMPGTTGQLPQNFYLQNRFIIVKPIGGGGMGAVYLATDARGTRWAIKEMSTRDLQPAEVPQAIAGFQQEASILTRSNQPNIPKAQPAFEQNSRWYFAMEFIDGKNLLELLTAQNNQPFAEALVLGWTRQLCDALEYLHAQQPPLIFRDLKPANVMLENRTGRIVLIDFGIARFFKPGRVRDTVAIGSAGYAALEQFGQAQTDARTDIHALGATMYHLLTGCMPPPATDRALNPGLLQPPERLNPQLSPHMSQVIQKALALHPNQRYQSVRELRAALFTTQPFPATLPVQTARAGEIETNLTPLMMWDFGFFAVKVLHKNRPTLKIRNLGTMPVTGEVRALVPWLHVTNGRFTCPPGREAQVSLLIDIDKYPVTQLVVEPLEISF